MDFLGCVAFLRTLCTLAGTVARSHSCETESFSRAATSQLLEDCTTPNCNDFVDKHRFVDSHSHALCEALEVVVRLTMQCQTSSASGRDKGGRDKGGESSSAYLLDMSTVVVCKARSPQRETSCAPCQEASAGQSSLG